MVCLPIPPRRRGAKPEGFYSIRSALLGLAPRIRADCYFGMSAGLGGVPGAGTAGAVGALGAESLLRGATGTGMSLGAVLAGAGAGMLSITPPPLVAGRLTAVPTYASPSVATKNTVATTAVLR